MTIKNLYREAIIIIIIILHAILPATWERPPPKTSSSITIRLYTGDIFMLKTFEEILDVVLEYEGELSNNRGDPGGLTKSFVS